jgi:hypothetical protein
MGRVSEYRVETCEDPETGEITEKPGVFSSIPSCSCGEVPSHGGNHLPVGPVICSRCALYGDLNSIGMALGDAILDHYKSRHTVNQQRESVALLVESILKRLEVSIYRAVAIGFNHLLVKKPYHGLKEDSER